MRRSLALSTLLALASCSRDRGRDIVVQRLREIPTPAKVTNPPPPAEDDAQVPLIRGTPGDHFPDRLWLRGRVTGVSPAFAACGILATAGSLEVKIEQAQPPFRRPRIVVVVPCLDRELGPAVGELVEGSATKLSLGACDQFVQNVRNRFDSGGAPAYCEELAPAAATR